MLLDPPRQAVEIAADDPVHGPGQRARDDRRVLRLSVTVLREGRSDARARSRRPTATRSGLSSRIFRCPIHPEAPKAAEAAHCAGEQGKYWEMHDRMFANQQAMDVPALEAARRRARPRRREVQPVPRFGKHADALADEHEGGRSAGRASTPTLYINGRPVVGAQPFEYFKTVIDEELPRK